MKQPKSRAKKGRDNKTTQNRPDPTFKGIIGQLAEQVGLKQLNVEIPQLVSADLILAKDSALDLSATMFYFFKDITVVEFKSENDTFSG